MYFANWLASITSSGLTRKAHSLTVLPISSRIFGLLHASMTIGTASSLTTGSAPRQAPLCVWPMITSTLSTSTSLRTALTASPGVPALSPKYSSIFRPMMPPLALYSSASICAAHLTPSPVMAEGPVMAEEKPTLMGGGLWAATRGTPVARGEDQGGDGGDRDASGQGSSGQGHEGLLRSAQPRMCSSWLERVSWRTPVAVISTASSTCTPPQPCS